MPLDEKRLQELDKISGLSSDRISQLDQIASGPSVTTPQDVRKPMADQSALEKVADFFFKNTSNAISSAVLGSQLNKDVVAANERIDALSAQNREIIRQAKETKDPYKKQQLLEQSRAISSQISGVASDVQDKTAQTKLSGGITDADMNRGKALIPGTENIPVLGGFNEFALRRGAGVALEAGATLLPGTTQAKALLQPAAGAALGSRFARGAATGAATGALQAGATAATEAESLGQAAGTVATGAGQGAVLGGLLNAALGKRPETAAKVVEQQKRTIYNELANDTTISSRRSKDIFKNQFNIPNKVARRIRFDDASEELVKHGVGGTMDDMINTSEYVTGRDGVLTNIHKQVIASQADEISSDAALDAAKKAIDEGSELSSADGDKITKYILKRLKPGKEIGKTAVPDAFDLVQDLEAAGYQNLNSSTVMTPNIKAEQKGRVYLAAAEALKEQIDQVTFDADALAQFKTPETENALKLVSKRLAKQFMNAKSSSDLRRIQAPFVTLKQAAAISVDKSNTPFANLQRGASGLDITKLPFQLAARAAQSPSGVQARTAISRASDQASQGPVGSLFDLIRKGIVTQGPRLGQ